MNKKFAICLFWGSVWGISEATIGFILHLLPISIGWMIWFPLAFYFLYKTYEVTASIKCLFLTVIIACCLKSVNIFIVPRIDLVVNPVAAMILESFAFAIVYKAKMPIFKQGLVSVIINYLWRFGYLAYMLAMPQAFRNLSPLSNATSLWLFLVVEPFFTSLIIDGMLFLHNYIRLTKKSLEPKMAMSVGTLVIAIILQLVL